MSDSVTIQTKLLALIREVASYFRESPVDGRYYLREGYASLPQDLISRLKQYDKVVT
jgi:hypothetical protein